jgi:hypothetical protein
MSEHHANCDGWRIQHNQTVEHSNSNGIGMRRLVCSEDGPVTAFVGIGVADASLRRMATCLPAWVECDDRCQEWTP